MAGKFQSLEISGINWNYRAWKYVALPGIALFVEIKPQKLIDCFGCVGYDYELNRIVL